jgi:NADP-dependent 3-hydroxy acid dehydrogenase YdfG
MSSSPLVVAITGASAGIGRATAERLAADGDIVVLFARRAGLLDTMAEDIRARGGHALAVPGDVCREPDVRAMVALSVSRFGKLDAMICNAGIGYNGTLDDTPPDAMRRLVDTNVMGTLYAAGAALEVFRRQGFGHIIAVSSIVGRRGVPGTAVYSATKAAQAGLIEALRAEFVGTDLRASIVYPVGVETEFHDAQHRHFGRRGQGRGPRQSAAYVADRIVSCIRSPRPEVYPHRLSRGLAIVNVLAPGVSDRLVRRFGRRVAAPGDPQEPGDPTPS